jgi:hypothetical protein
MHRVHRPSRNLAGNILGEVFMISASPPPRTRSVSELTNRSQSARRKRSRASVSREQMRSVPYGIDSGERNHVTVTRNCSLSPRPRHGRFLVTRNTKPCVTSWTKLSL